MTHPLAIFRQSFLINESGMVEKRTDIFLNHAKECRHLLVLLKIQLYLALFLMCMRFSVFQAAVLYLDEMLLTNWLT